MPARTRVLYIAGAGRSGTNFLGQVLGQADGFCFVGEAMYGGPSLATRRCGCGVPLGDCEFWADIRREVGRGRPLDEKTFFGLGRLARWRHLPSSFTRSGARRLAARYGAEWQRAALLYAAVARASGAQVVVDASKSVPYARMLTLVPELDVRVVHLVRDARAVAHSRQRQKVAPDRFGAEYMGRRGPALTTLYWMVTHLGTEMFLRRVPYVRLRYEDLVVHPRESIEAALRLAVDRDVEAPLAGPRAVELGVAHSVCGNPDRLRTGLVEIRDDDEWKTRLSPSDHRAVTAMAWPLLGRYGYLRRSPGPTSPSLATRPPKG